ncbi:ABC transporter substrate-binding protein [Nocardioides sp. BGMRC 2183]|nr:ABC transporter substrate-binding protein [Nocardioides sp. BGMRC 2183]
MSHVVRSSRSASIGGATVLAAALALTSACGTSDAEPTSKTTLDPDQAVAGLYDQLPQSIKDKGRIDNVVVNSYPPFEFIDEESDELQGLDIDLANRLSEVIGIEIKFNQTSEFTQLVPSVQTGRADMGLSGTLDKPERQGSVDFVDYFKTGTQFVAPEDSGLSDVDALCGKTVATGTGTSYPDEIAAISDERCADGDEIEVIGVQPVLSVMLQQVSIGRADAAFWATDSTNWELSQNSQPFEIVGDPIFTGKVYGASVNKDLPELRDVIQQGLQAMVKDGSYAEILAKWGQEAGALKTITINEGVD